MILNSVSSIYGAAAAWRRRWYQRHPDRLKRLKSPVISVGNLSVGGSGKTPVVEYLARLLQQAGERPAILTRGYARQRATSGVTVVSDPTRVVAGLAESGDEPFMLAKALPGVSVLVTADRFEAGTLAETRFGATVHLLDDGFQHVMLDRDLDLLLIDDEDLSDRPLPAGRLREPVSAASTADAWLVPYDSRIDDAVRRRFGVTATFQVRRTLGAAHLLGDARTAAVASGPAIAMAGIARPQRFFDALRGQGWTLADTLAFPDHHQFSNDDISVVAARMTTTKARIVLTTEKDATRLEAIDLRGLPVTVVPLSIAIEPAERFREWLLQQVGDARKASSGPSAVRASRS